jgi:hypothetical protein
MKNEKAKIKIKNKLNSEKKKGSKEAKIHDMVDWGTFVILYRGLWWHGPYRESPSMS